MNKCETCKHWDYSKFWDVKTVADEYEEFLRYHCPETHLNLGRCNQDVEQTQFLGILPNRTHKDFGCIYWEKKQ